LALLGKSKDNWPKNEKGTKLASAARLAVMSENSLLSQLKIWEMEWHKCVSSLTVSNSYRIINVPFILLSGAYCSTLQMKTGSFQTVKIEGENFNSVSLSKMHTYMHKYILYIILYMMLFSVYKVTHKKK
jgi:hypothetical protein